MDTKIPFRSNKSVIRKLLSDRAKIYYQALGTNILNSNLIESTVKKSNGDLPFAVIVDIIVTNKENGNLDAVYENIDEVIEVVLNNFNRMVPPHKGIHNPLVFKRNVLSFIQEQRF